MKRLVTIGLMVLLIAGGTNADITKYTSVTTWDAAVSNPVSTITWDDVDLADGSSTTISGTRYSAMPGSPTLSVDAGSGLWVVDPDSDSVNFFGTDFFPVSGDNVFSPDNWPEPAVGPEGILTISFSQPVSALGAWFLDVEEDWASTGIKIGTTLYAFTGSQGDNSQSFLGIVSTTPFTTAEIHMSSAPGGNGVGIDDTMYALVPVPAAVLLGMLGLAAAGLKLREYV